MTPDLRVYVVGIGPALIMFGWKVRVPDQHTVDLVQVAGRYRTPAVPQAINGQRVVQEFSLRGEYIVSCFLKQASSCMEEYSQITYW